MLRSQIYPMPPFFDRYIPLADDIDLVEALQKSLQEFVEYDFSLLGRLGTNVYEEGKWTVKEILLHVIDNERIQAYRALRFARNDATVLPGYDEQLLVSNSDANNRTIQDLKNEFIAVRLSTITLFKSFSDEALQRIGTAFQVQITPLALGFVIVGHQIHHFNVLNERYLPLLKTLNL